MRKRWIVYVRVVLEGCFFVGLFDLGFRSRRLDAEEGVEALGAADRGGEGKGGGCGGYGTGEEGAGAGRGRGGAAGAAG